MKRLKKTISLIVLNYLRILARVQIRKINPVIIGITGTAGKTSAMNAVGAVLSSKYKVKMSLKANSESGIPANILGLEFHSYSAFEWFKILIMAPIKLLTNNQKYDYYIAEMGIDSPDEPKNMSYLLKIIKPHISIFLNVYPMHSEYFDKLVDKKIKGDKRIELISEEIAKEKGKIITTLSRNDYAVVNTDNEFVYNESLKVKAQVKTFGQNGSPDVKLVKTKVSLDGTKFYYNFNNEEFELSLESKLLPLTYGYSFASALLVGQICDIKIEDGIKAIEQNYNLPPGRSSILHGKKDSIIIDSSYNSSYEATLSMIELVSELKSKKKVFVAGDMRELGEVTEIMHEKLAKASIKEFDHIITVGPLTLKYMVPELIKSGFDKSKIHTFATAGEAVKFIQDELLEQNMLFLIKGSQNTIFLEIVVESLLNEAEDKEKLLCRRGKYWDDLRSDFN